MNTIIIIGRLGADPESRFTPNNKKVSTLRLASNTWDGKQEITTWYDVTVWGEHPLLVRLKKGDAVVITGELQKIDLWTDKGGQTRVTPRVKADSIKYAPGSGSKQNGEGGESTSRPTPETAYAAAPAYGQGSDSFSNTTEDDLPF